MIAKDFKIVVVTRDEFCNGEAFKLNEILAEVDLLHIRKSSGSITELENLLGDIKPEYYPKISLHQEHRLLNKYRFGGVHFKELHDSVYEEKLLSELKEKHPDLRVSRSFHTLKDVAYCPANYSYLFLSPVFNSISKSNYPASFEEKDLYWAQMKMPAFLVARQYPPEGQQKLPAKAIRAVQALSTTDFHSATVLSNRAFSFAGSLKTLLSDTTQSVYALGGVSPDNITKLSALGFKGAVLHGYLWQRASPVEALLEFKASLLRELSYAA